MQLLAFLQPAAAVFLFFFFFQQPQLGMAAVGLTDGLPAVGCTEAADLEDKLGWKDIQVQARLGFLAAVRHP